MACVASVIYAVNYIKDSGVLRPYPDPTYLTEEEAALRPLYNNLSEKEKAVYTAIYRGALKQEDKIELPYEIDGDTYSRLYCMLEKQEPELFWLGSSYYYSERVRTAQIISNETAAENYKNQAQELEEKADEIMAGLPQTVGDYEKALYIHDYIARSCVYEIGEEEDGNSSAYSCLVKGEALCEGYAKAFDYLAERAGLECVVITGVTNDGENHAWNQVRIDGEWYNVDLTWDDTDNELEVVHTYFLQSDEVFGISHEADDNPVYPVPFECSDENDYHKREELYSASDEETQLILIREISAGTEVIELKFASRELYDKFGDDYAEGDRIFDLLLIYRNTISGDGMSISYTEYEEELCIALYIG